MRSGDGLSLAERSQRSLRTAESKVVPEPESTLDPTRVRPVGQRHCWVTDLPDAPGQKFAGLVVNWAWTPEGGWAGRTIYVVDDQQPAVVIEAWVPATHLRPA